MPPRASIRHESLMPGAADVVEDRRDAVRRELAHAREDVLAAVVDRGRAELAQPLLLLRPGGPDHVDARVAGELDEHRPDAARRAEDDDRLRRA